MRKQLRIQLHHHNNLGFPYTLPVVFIGIVVLVVLAALLLNTTEMHRRLRENTKSYADDISAQLASNISSRMELRGNYIGNLADTFSGMPRYLLTEELMDRKAEYLEMESILVVNADGTTVPADTGHPELGGYLAEHPALRQEPHIFFTEHNEVFFSAPIFWKDGEAPGILMGVRSNATLQQMLQEVDFRDQGLCCITDGSGAMIISPTDNAPFLELGDIFAGALDDDDAAEVGRVLEDIGERRSGVAQFQDIGGEPLMLCYDFLGINDWILLTLFPSDLFSEGTEPYLIRYVVIIGIMALVALLILSYVIWICRRSIREIQTIAFTDPLTEGKNHLAFQVEGAEILQKNPQQAYAIVFLNIRRFKQLNERFGISAGNHILRQIYRVLRECLSGGELAARSEGDHFYLLLRCADEDAVRSRLEGMLKGLEAQLSGQFSIDRAGIAQGAYLIRERDADFLLLQDRAKVASAFQMEEEPCRFYDDNLGMRLRREQNLDRSFERAMQNHEFKLYLQPKVSLRRNEICGGEVLARWEHPEYGFLSPGEFIPLFERSRKICDLDFYMFEETCGLLKGWLAEGRAVPLSVNLSRAHLLSGDLSFLDRLRAIKQAYQIPDGLIELELTESLMLERQEIGAATDMVERIRSMGFLCSMDDFGFGYSSLALLKDLNVDTIKMDRQFFLWENKRSWIVVRQLIGLAHELGISVVAEGIEHQSQVAQLRQCGCDAVQGYVYAKPMTAADFQTWSP